MARYEYKGRNYQVVIDGVDGDVLYGKAPGNIFYRAAMLVGGMALGNLVLVNACAFLLLFADSSSSSDSEGGIGVLLVPIVIGGAIMYGGYRAFRYGEEVEKLDRSNRKAEGVSGSTNGSGNLLETAVNIGRSGGDSGDLLKMGMKFLDEL